MTNEKKYVTHYCELTGETIILNDTVPVELRPVLHPLRTYVDLEEAEFDIANPDPELLAEELQIERDRALKYVFNNYIKDSIGYEERIQNKVKSLMDKPIKDNDFFSKEYQEILRTFVTLRIGDWPTKNNLLVRRELEDVFSLITLSLSNKENLDLEFRSYFGLLLLNCRAGGAIKEADELSRGVIVTSLYYVVESMNANYVANIEDSETIPRPEEEKPSIVDAVETIHSVFEENPSSEKAYDIIKEGLGEEAANALMEMVSDSPAEEIEEIVEEIVEVYDEDEEIDEPKEELTESEKLEEVLGVVIPELEKNLMDKPVEELGPKEMRLVMNKMRRSNFITVGAIFRISKEKVKAIYLKWNSKFSSDEERDARLIELWNEGVPNADIKDECHIVNDAELKSIAKRLGLGRKLNKPITVQEIDLNKPEYQQAIELYKENRTYADIRLKTGLSQHYLNKVFEEAIKQGLIEPREKDSKQLGKTHTLTEIAKMTNRPIDDVKMYCLAHNIKMAKHGRGFVISDEDFATVVSGMSAE